MAKGGKKTLDMKHELNIGVLINDNKDLGSILMV